ncbi:pyruvate dehydrogenase [Stappia sp. GBMRC 2046]|uniref:Pyruvate dehydrogenase n=1 Tax=Stappia sediminis TaxID=2692190 RepID=A0A7X3S7N3_9HYPH|nr:biotin/lipoyl-containing protein [Stappia sediminis]MXN64920.1 pyruvate dehydrogenase [Stappia sediminis]
MPHEVIMPALGMAQDTGLIVAWHKSPGDTVNIGDVLFEVETDKATMEVEAQSEGFITQIRHYAGDDVPVGEVIAVIDESTEAVHTDETPTGTSAPAVEVPKGAEVIMPALGMAQDTGVIVAWHKAPGDPVTASDILFEVETDKATMEVEAGRDGYVAALLVEAGEEAPVGDAIAVIAAEKPANAVQLSRHVQSAAAAKPAEMPEARPESTQDAAPTKIAEPAIVAEGSKILASPKARRLAQKQGLDLNRLVKAGVPQPFHVSDLETLKALPDEKTASATATLHISARADAHGFAAFADRLAEKGAATGVVWAAFAAASLRATEANGGIVVRLENPLLGQSALFNDPDQTPLSAVAPCEAGAPRIILRDLTASRITGLSLTCGDTPVLTVTRDAKGYHLALDFTETQLPGDAAIRLIEGVAARLDEPSRHLL